MRRFIEDPPERRTERALEGISASGRLHHVVLQLLEVLLDVRDS